MIKFKVVRWKNLLSTGNSFTEIKLDTNPTTILLGESGSGKSSILDAITFVLFNKPFRNITKSQIVNSINEKNCLAEIEFDIGEKEYKVRRGIKPNVFEIYCDGQLLNQDADSRNYQTYLETQILKANYRAFTQIVILGAAGFTSFMNLKPQERRTIIEGLLDIEIFSVMNNLLKQKISGVKQAIQDNEHSIIILKEKVLLHEKYLEDISKDKESKIQDNLKQIEDNKNQIKLLEDENTKHSTQINEVEVRLEFKKEVLSQIEELKSINRSLSEKGKKLEKEIVFYEQHDECPSCTQELTPQFKQKQIEDKKQNLVQISEETKKAETRLNSCNSRIQEAAVLEKEIEELKFKINKANNSIDAIKKFIQKLAKETLEIKKEVSKVEPEKDTTIQGFNNEIETLNKNHQKLGIERSVNDLAISLLKDNGVKAKIIKQYLPLINKYTNTFLNRMNFFVTFQIDEEFNEQIKSRGRDQFCYANFSEGEKQRIDLALLFTWRAIAKMKNSVSTNLLILDEVLDSYLDTAATESVLQLLNSELFKGTNIFVISHKETITDKFHANIRFTKKKNFSIIE